ncbi:uncharacterized protein [Triticum aestivum]|uniref:uncharacterized protein n=1 Tax=Triticum aestivum TaxID=4565 RepID=UPI001D0151DF|nr:uncharacterized protein LOC123180575 [Triticum aestivum]
MEALIGDGPLRSPFFSMLLKMAMVDVRGDDVSSWLQARASLSGIKYGSPGSSGRHFHARQSSCGVRKAMAPLTPTTHTVRSLPLAKFAGQECSVCFELLADTQYDRLAASLPS